jgi:hypothetical protein
MSEIGHKRTLTSAQAMSAILPKADVPERDRHVRFVP